jgi:transcriptional/translational regulatory protein YebC/TACO1
MYEVYTASSDLHAVSKALEDMGIEAKEAKLTMVPNTLVEVDGKTVAQVLKLMEALEDNDDVQDVFSNVEISDEAMAEAMAD